MGYREIIEAGKKERDTSVLFGEDEYRSKVKEIVGAGGRNSNFRSHAFDEEIDKVGKDLNEKIKHYKFDNVEGKDKFVTDTLYQAHNVLVARMFKAEDLVENVTPLQRDVALQIEGGVERALNRMNWSENDSEKLDEQSKARVFAYNYAKATITTKITGKEPSEGFEIG